MTFLPQELIRRKRDRGRYTDQELEWIVASITDGSLSDAQVGAWAMAVLFNGLEKSERIALTRAMTHSGTVLDWSFLDRPAVDKHSTGGVGDKVSLILAPLVAACGGAVPMIAGRGLGHTGGTLDKLDAIPGYNTRPDLDRLRKILPEVHCAIVGQTSEIAPADRRLYALRDATSTVESIPLIVASILSKKLAAGLDALVLDVKVGSGAFMEKRSDALELARSLTEVATGNGLRCNAVLTDMDQVLGHTAGNALEVIESIDVLTGRSSEENLIEVTIALAAQMLELGDLADGPDEARSKVKSALDSGAGAEHFSRMVHALGGPSDLLERHDHYLKPAKEIIPVYPTESGVIEKIDVRQVGIAVLELGGGRRNETDSIDYSVGLSEVAGLGTSVGPKDRPIAIVHANDLPAAERAATRLRTAFEIGAIVHQSPALLEYV